MTAGLSFRWRLGPEDHTDKNPPAPAVLVFARQIAELDGKNAEHDEKAIERGRDCVRLVVAAVAAVIARAANDTTDAAARLKETVVMLPIVANTWSEGRKP